MHRIDSMDDLLSNSIFVGNYMGARGIGVGYMTDAYVTQYSNDGKKETTFKINYIFPIAIDEIALNGEEYGKISSTDVTFAFSSYERVSNERASGNFLRNLINI